MSAAPEIVCSECENRLYVWVENQGYAPCPACHAEKDLRDRLRRADVPERYINCRMKSFVPQNADQIAVVKALDESLKAGAVKSLVLVGDPGVGKSHLAVALLTEHIKRNRKYGMFLSVTDLFLRLHREMNASKQGDHQADGRPGVLEEAMQQDILLLDDLGSERPTAYTRDTIYSLLDHRYTHELPLIVTTNLRGGKLSEHVGERLYSRLAQMCRTVEVVGRDYRLGRGAA